MLEFDLSFVGAVLGFLFVRLHCHFYFTLWPLILAVHEYN